MTSYPVAAVKLSHDVIELLVDRGKAGVTEVATALDVPKSTAHDHLRTLEQVGDVVNEDGAYRLSMQFLHVGEIARNHHDLFVQGREETLGLFETIDERHHVQLVTVEHGRCALLLASRWQRETLSQQATTYPRHAHLHTNAPGKAIFAHLDEEKVKHVLAEHGLPPRTPATITDETDLATELARVREDGYAVDDGELIAGMTGIAAPIVTDTEVHGSIAVYSTTDQFTTDPRNSELVDTVRESADEIRANLIFARE
ncbi:IclR family transcriptional regulator [Halococcus saccharolyticus]|uniref:IclR family transcriptional regulator n=1 Tax=Halococcus saccharolyticus DSM 5350 TaxID=1227455 RepID=M0MHA5_9EURY|nr:IclR family transcriptional regulator C-terminal domain-containing protein [Halococcus saccharolyticus]EMA45112.1 IclR family transcriptional regulator [Halococcus saccharolyticus DSM 5350]